MSDTCPTCGQKVEPLPSVGDLWGDQDTGECFWILNVDLEERLATCLNRQCNTETFELTEFREDAGMGLVSHVDQLDQALSYLRGPQ